MQASSIIAGWKRRLVALAHNPPFEFKDTPQQLIDERYRQLTTFAGYAEREIAGAEAELGIKFPEVFRVYLSEMGHSSGCLFSGSDLARLPDFERFRMNALTLLARTTPTVTLPRDAVVFLFHERYMFLYIIAAAGFDGPVMQWNETHYEPRQIASTFAAMVQAELSLMEKNDSTRRERGGYYMTLYPDGGKTEIHPALGSSDKPLSRRRD